MKGYKRFVIAFIVLFVLFIITDLTAPKPTDWKETLRDDDKNPYGTYVLRQSLPSLFEKARVENIDIPFYNFTEQYDGKKDSNQLYISVAPQMNLSNTEITQLFNFAKRGNYVLLSAEEFGKKLNDSLHIKNKTYFFNLLDSSRVNFLDANIRTAKGYSFYSQTIDNYFSKLPKTATIDSLGMIEQNKEINFIKVNMGKGAIFLHASPICFTNAFQLYKNNYKYTEQVLSFLPQKIHTLYWDQYYSQGDDNEPQTPFRYFLTHFWLRIGFYMAWILLILYVLFSGKRRQRTIPIILPPRNTTEDFIQTISSLYYNQKSGKEIFEKKVYHWLNYIRNNLHLDTDQVSTDDFWEKLAEKSNIDKSLLQEIREQIIALQTRYNENTFKELYKNIEHFYQQIKK